MDFRVLVIIVTYNGKPWIKNCLDSLQKSNYLHDVILIDNCSVDDTVLFVEENYSYIKVIKPLENLGFGKANNIGLSYAVENSYDYVLLLNQDVYIEGDMIDELVCSAQANPEYGIISPLQLTGDGKNFDRNFDNIIKDKVSNIIDNKVLKYSNMPIIDVNFVMAAIWFMSIDTIKAVGGFSPLFFHYGEDNDYANRVLCHKMKIGVLPSCSGYHDREFRKINRDKWLYMYGYVRYLYTLSNINYSFFLTFLCFVFLFFIRSTQVLVRMNFSLFVKNIQYFMSIIKDLSKIISTRKLYKDELNSYLFLSK